MEYSIRKCPLLILFPMVSEDCKKSKILNGVNELLRRHFHNFLKGTEEYFCFGAQLFIYMTKFQRKARHFLVVVQYS